MIDKYLQEFFETKCLWLALDERYSVNCKGIFHWSELEELFKNIFWFKTVLKLDNDVGTCLTISEIYDVRDSLDLLRLSKVSDTFNNLFRADIKWELLDDDAHLA